MGQSILGIDEGIEDLVVVGRGQIEQLADGLFLGPRVLPPLPLQGQHLLVADAERRLRGHPTRVSAGSRESGGILRGHVLLRCFGHDTLLVDSEKTGWVR